MVRTLATVVGVVSVVVAGPRAAPSPAAGLIVFDSTRAGGQRLFAIRPDGSGLRLLGPAGTDARVSPDGKEVVFSGSDYRVRVLDLRTGHIWTPAGRGGVGLGWDSTRWPWSPDSRHFAVGSDAGLVVFPARGGVGRTITSAADASPAWAPDGKHIAYASSGGISVVGADGNGNARVVADGGDPEWSPDGRTLAFTRLVGSAVVTFVVPAAGGAARRVAAGFPAWAPDGRTLALADDGGLALYDRDGRLVRTLLRGRGAADPSWSPDGRNVVAVVGGDLWRFARDGRGKVPMTTGERDGYANEGSSWAADAPATLTGRPAAATRGVGGPLVALSLRSGAPDARFPRVSGSNAEGSGTAGVMAITQDGHGGWYVGGDFAAVGGVACRNLVHVTSAERVDRTWCPQPNGTIRSLARVGSTLFVGGENLTRVDGASRHGLAAFDTTTGTLEGWNPDVDGPVYELAADPAGTTVYFSGLFDRVGHVARANLAAVDARSAAPTAFAPNPDATIHGDCVQTFVVTQSRVYVSGYFSRIGGEPTGRRVVGGAVADLDRDTGTVLSWRPAVLGEALQALVRGNRVIVGGARLAAFDAGTASLDAWTPTTPRKRAVEALTEHDGVVYAAFTGNHWEPGQRIVAGFDDRTGAPRWRSPTVLDGEVDAMAASDTLLLLGGGFGHAH